MGDDQNLSGKTEKPGNDKPLERIDESARRLVEQVNETKKSQEEPKKKE